LLFLSLLLVPQSRIEELDMQRLFFSLSPITKKALFLSQRTRILFSFSVNIEWLPSIPQWSFLTKLGEKGVPSTTLAV